MNAVAVVATNWLYHSHSEVMCHLAFRLVHVMWYNLESIPLCKLESDLRFHSTFQHQFTVTLAWQPLQRSSTLLCRLFTFKELTCARRRMSRISTTAVLLNVISRRVSSSITSLTDMAEKGLLLSDHRTTCQHNYILYSQISSSSTSPPLPPPTTVSVSLRIGAVWTGRVCLLAGPKLWSVTTVDVVLLLTLLLN